MNKCWIIISITHRNVPWSSNDIIHHASLTASFLLCSCHWPRAPMIELVVRHTRQHPGSDMYELHFIVKFYGLSLCPPDIFGHDKFLHGKTCQFLLHSILLKHLALDICGYKLNWNKVSSTSTVLTIDWGCLVKQHWNTHRNWRKSHMRIFFNSSEFLSSFSHPLPPSGREMILSVSLS